MMETILEYYVINPITNIPIDYKSKSITVNHNIDYIMVTIKKVKPSTLGLLEQINLTKPPSRDTQYNSNDLLSYIEKIRKQLDKQVKKQLLELEYDINYYIVPLAIYTNKLILGIIVFSPVSIASNNILGCWNLLSSISSISSDCNCNYSSKTGFDILAGILNFSNTASNNKNQIPKELKRYFINAHNYLPKFKVIRKEKTITKNIFQIHKQS